MEFAVTIALKVSSKPGLTGPCNEVQLKTSPSPGQLHLAFSFLPTSTYNLLSAQLVWIFLFSPVDVIQRFLASPVKLFDCMQLLQLLAGFAVPLMFTQKQSCSAACLCHC